MIDSVRITDPCSGSARRLRDRVAWQPYSSRRTRTYRRIYHDVSRGSGIGPAVTPTAARISRFLVLSFVCRHDEWELYGNGLSKGSNKMETSSDKLIVNQRLTEERRGGGGRMTQKVSTNFACIVWRVGLVRVTRKPAFNFGADPCITLRMQDFFKGMCHCGNGQS